VRKVQGSESERHSFRFHHTFTILGIKAVPFSILEIVLFKGVS